ncbi:hypothetical protein CHU92_06745 [Flavobacterium cyanobacteriorum]|uniref:Uncharacterized protein n=1 Tax=Flavobacterium cyanobacteriorum TaxID=2022802 RepID=A0A255Z9H8_9FLAO|nr:hypothetical protein [Flavobacterium cyanobacteriorum]OYQ38071.1 hypothetical protein CHU92_06745 [Flavobacterium cyanobacteriorum]
MKINLKSGVGELLFGMKEKDVQAVYGQPDSVYKDEDKNIIYIYNALKLRLTFYHDEDFRLGYIISSNPALEFAGQKIIGQKWPDVEKFAADNKIRDFVKENFDASDNYFNEDNWIIFQVEFDEVIKVELGAIINNKDEFEWKFR